MKSTWHLFIHPITKYFRKKRFQIFLQEIPNLLEFKILDLGGSVHFWEKLGVDINAHDITLLNVNVGQALDSRGGSSEKIVLYDGKRIPYPDGAFDVVISNSVIEHVPPDQRVLFCSEARRVSKRYLIQTPAYEFPVEPHFVMPFIHWLPRTVGRFLARYSVWAILGRVKKEHANTYFDEVQLLKLNEFHGYFPDAKIITERVGLFRKSYIATGASR